MFRTIYNEASSSSSSSPSGTQNDSWYSANNRSRSNDMTRASRKKTTLERFQCMMMMKLEQLFYGHYWNWFKKSIGFFLLLSSISLLFWNEKRAVESSRSYHDGMKSVTIVSRPEYVLPQNEGKLVHVSGYLRIQDPLEDFPYGVSIYAVKLKRRVQMYQWFEESVGQGTEIGMRSVRYSKSWKDKLIESYNFQVPNGHENPKKLPLESEVWINPHIYIGNYELGLALKEKFKTFVEFTSGERPEPAEIKMHMGLYYHSADIWHPSVGDIRIQFSFAGSPTTFVSVVAMQSGNYLRPFTTESGASIAFLHEGKKHHSDMFNREHYTVAVESWVYRVGSFALTILGVYLTSKMVTLIGKRNWIMRNLILMGPEKFSLLVATFICLSIIGCTWFPHKPLFGILLVTFSSALVVYFLCAGGDGRGGYDQLRKTKVSLPQYTKMS